MVHLHASQFVEVDIAPAPIPIGQYLQNTERLVYALAEPSQIKSVGNHVFRFSMQPFKFLMLTLAPVADIEIYSNKSNEVIIYSDSCYLQGQAVLNRRFSFQLKGWLVARADNSGVSGNAELNIDVDLPPAFRLTPQGLLESTGNTIVGGILNTIKHRLQYRLVHEYKSWANGILESTHVR